MRYCSSHVYIHTYKYYNIFQCSQTHQTYKHIEHLHLDIIYKNIIIAKKIFILILCSYTYLFTLFYIIFGYVAKTLSLFGSGVLCALKFRILKNCFNVFVWCLNWPTGTCVILKKNIYFYFWSAAAHMTGHFCPPTTLFIVCYLIDMRI